MGREGFPGTAWHHNRIICIRMAGAHGLAGTNRTKPHPQGCGQARQPRAFAVLTAGSLLRLRFWVPTQNPCANQPRRCCHMAHRWGCQGSGAAKRRQDYSLGWSEAKPWVRSPKTSPAPQGRRKTGLQQWSPSFGRENHLGQKVRKSLCHFLRPYRAGWVLSTCATRDMVNTLCRAHGEHISQG